MRANLRHVLCCRGIFVATALATCVAAVSGCATYHAHPLRKKDVRKALQTPPEQTLRVAISKIHHPILKPVAFDPRNGISPQEAAMMAVVLNPRLRAARDERGVAKAEVIQAGILPNPQFTGELDVPVGGQAAGTGLAHVAGLSWDFTGLISRSARVDSAKDRVKSVDLDIAWKEWQVAQGARLAAIRVLALKRRVQLAHATTGIYIRRLRLLQQALKRGDATLLEVSTARNAVLEAQLAEKNLQQQLEQQRLALNADIGLPPTTRLRLQNVPLPTWSNLPGVKSLLRGLQHRRLDLVALRRGYESQEARVHAAILRQFPPISVGVINARDTSFIDTVGPSVTIDIPIFDRNQGVIATTRATRKKLYDTYVARTLDARNQVARIRALITSVRARLKAAEDGLPNLQNLTRLAQQQAQSGTLNILQVTDLSVRLLALRLRILRFRQTIAELGISLEIASGRYLEPIEHASVDHQRTGMVAVRSKVAGRSVTARSGPPPAARPATPAVSATKTTPTTKESSRAVSN